MSTYSEQTFKNFSELLNDVTIEIFNKKIEQCFNIKDSLKVANMKDQDLVRMINFFRSIGIKNLKGYVDYIDP